MAKYGTDKPDLRNPIVMQEVSDRFRGGGFGLFARILEDAKNAVWGIPAPKGGSRAFCDRMNSWAQGEGQPGLGYIFWSEDQGGWGGPIAKNLGPEKTDTVMGQLGMGKATPPSSWPAIPRCSPSSPVRPAPRWARICSSSTRTASSSSGSSTSRCSR
jgi:aspartyl-tRNA synthetase